MYEKLHAIFWLTDLSAGRAVIARTAVIVLRKSAGVNLFRAGGKRGDSPLCSGRGRLFHANKPGI